LRYVAAIGTAFRGEQISRGGELLLFEEEGGALHGVTAALPVSIANRDGKGQCRNAMAPMKGGDGTMTSPIDFFTGEHAKVEPTGGEPMGGRVGMKAGWGVKQIYAGTYRPPLFHQAP
jgi:hypothetical protein